MLGILNAITPFSIDLYLPAFPQIAQTLNTTLAKVSFSVSSYFIGYAFGQLLYGPLLDRFGRKPPLYAGIIIYIIASIACMTSSSIDQLMLYRVFQALGGCVTGVAAMAMVKDFFPASEGAKIFSLLMLVLSASPLLAPSVGSFIAAAWGWQATFAVLALIAFLVMAMVFFFLPTSYTGDKSLALSPIYILNSYKEILKVRKFLIYTVAGSFSFAGLFVYIAASPAIFMDGFKVSPQIYSAIFAFLAVGMIGSTQLNIPLMKHFNSESIFKTAVKVQVLLGGLFMLGAWNDWYGLGATIALLFVVLSCAGITSPNATSLALSPFSKNAGTASATLGFLQLGIGSAISGTIGLFDIKGTLPTALVIFFSAIISLSILVLGKQPVTSSST